MITTKKGDGGETSLGGKRVPKTSEKVVLLGKIDALISYLGVAAEHCKEKEELLEAMQDACYRLMSAIHEGKDVSEGEVEAIEQHIHEISLKEFIRPSGRAAHIHFARTLCREAEIAAFRALGACNISKALNRMSDALFIAAYEAAEELEGFRRKG